MPSRPVVAGGRVRRTAPRHSRIGCFSPHFGHDMSRPALRLANEMRNVIRLHVICSHKTRNVYCGYRGCHMHACQCYAEACTAAGRQQLQLLTTSRSAAAARAHAGTIVNFAGRKFRAGGQAVQARRVGDVEQDRAEHASLSCQSHRRNDCSDCGDDFAHQTFAAALRKSSSWREPP